MYRTSTRLSLLLLSLAVFCLMMVGRSYSKIDPETVMGVWLLDDGQGKTAVDSSKNAYDGKITGSQWVAGKFGKALEFDGKADNVEVPDALFDILDPKELDVIPQITVVCWVNYNKEPPQNYAPVGKEPLYRFIIGKGGSGHFVVATAANGWYTAGTVASGAGITQGEWHHLAGTYNGKKVRFYVDGKLAGEGPQNIAGDILDNASGFTIAKTIANNVDFFAGVIDDIAVFKVAISEEDIKNIMAIGLEKTIAGKSAVSDHGKLSATWASIKLKFL